MAVTHNTGKALAGRMPVNLNTRGQSHFQLQARPEWSNVLKQRQGPLGLIFCILPADLDHICAHHPCFPAPILHALLIGGRRPPL